MGIRFLTLVGMGLAGAAVAAPAERRIAAVVVTMDSSSESMVLKLEGYLNESLKEFQGLQVRSSDELFGVQQDDEAAASLMRAETSFREAKSAFEKRADDAERKLRLAVREYSKAIAAMRGCGNLCDAMAMVGAALHARGDLEEAKVALLDLISVGGPGYELDRKRFSQEYLSLRTQISSGRSGQLRGSLVVKTRPAGARVFLNGDFQGYSPLTLPTLPVGKAMVKIERPGFKQVGQMLDVSPEDQELSLDLAPSPAFKAFDDSLDKLASEALKDRAGPAMAAAAKSLGLERALIAVLREVSAGAKSELTLVYYDVKTGKRLGIKRATFAGDEYGQLKGEVGRMVNGLVNTSEGGGPEKVRSSDPLDGKGGMEEWNTEDRGGRSTARDKKKRAGDPLDGMQGTEDW